MSNNSYEKPIMPDTNSGLTWGESNLYWNKENGQNISTSIVGALGASLLSNSSTVRNAGKVVIWDDEGAVHTCGNYLWR